jgi:hypothetical protein
MSGSLLCRGWTSGGESVHAGAIARSGSIVVASPRWGSMSDEIRSGLRLAAEHVSTDDEIVDLAAS